MSEIKVGDRVRCVDTECIAKHFISDSRVYVVRREFQRGLQRIVELDGVPGEWSATRFVKIEDAAEPVVQVPLQTSSTDVQAATPRFEVIRRVGGWGVLDSQLQRVAKTSARDTADIILSACEKGDYVWTWSYLHECSDTGITRLDGTSVMLPAPSQVPSEPVAADTDRVRCTWWERNGFVYDEREQRWVLPPATERAAREADTQAAWDRFAAAAMKGLFAGDTRKTMEPDEVCRLAKECADEMIAHRADSRAAREKGGA